MPRAGIVTVVGKPNVGKSTLLNRIVGQKLSITSPKPQSTRDRVVGIYTADDSQMVILDTPGLLNPGYLLQQAMRSTALRALDEADVIVYLADATEGKPPSLVEAAELASPPRAPVITVLNKSDAVHASRRDEAGVGEDFMHVSALTGDGIPELMARIARQLPESPFLYPEDDISTQPVRFFVAELVRETVLEQLHDEVPYAVAVQVEEFREERSPLYIRAVIYVERDSQKAIIIGSKGAQIKSIGEAARKRSKRSSVPKCISICGSKSSPTGARTRAVFHDLVINSQQEKANELVPSSPRNSRLPQVQERARVSRVGAGAPLP